MLFWVEYKFLVQVSQLQFKIFIQICIDCNSELNMDCFTDLRMSKVNRWWVINTHKFWSSNTRVFDRVSDFGSNSFCFVKLIPGFYVCLIAFVSFYCSKSLWTPLSPNIKTEKIIKRTPINLFIVVYPSKVLYEKLEGS